MTQTYPSEEDIDDFTAWNDILGPSGYKCKSGMIYHPDPSHVETGRECFAINTLCIDWDYGFWTAKEAEEAGALNVPDTDGEPLGV